MKVMMKYSLIPFFLFYVVLLHGQSSYQQFQDLIAAFEKEYTQLDIPELELSYVNNLNNVSGLKDLNAQKEFFLKYQSLLTNYSVSALSEKEIIIHAVLIYEIGLNLERIDLETKWLEQKEEALEGTCLYNEIMGPEWYAYFLKKWVDKALTPEGTFQFGLEEIQRVKSAMKDVQEQSGFVVETFNQKWNVNTNAITDKNVVLEEFKALHEKVVHRAKDYFPGVDKIRAIHITEGTNPDFAIVPGYYYDNTFFYNFFGESFDGRDMGWIYIHEAIPGHHYQYNFAEQYSTDVLELFYYMGYIEGWAAYIEQFGSELGAYPTPFDAYAWLQWELIRSVRVALDVGLNYYGWSDEKALAFWQQHIPDNDAVADREIKRMKRWPAQVVTYKHGRRIFDELRGNRNTPEELKSFHQQVLEHGDIPLSVLREHILKSSEQVEQAAPTLPQPTTLDETIAALYQVISGAKGEARDWAFFRGLFHPDAKIIASGSRGASYFTIDEFINTSGKWMLDNGFYENEMKRIVQQFGSMAQVFSSYECFHTRQQTTPFMRGINSIQFMFNGERWQIINLQYTQETADNPIPSNLINH